MKPFEIYVLDSTLMSPLARGAWIETISGKADRMSSMGRPSREGRGLKLAIERDVSWLRLVAPRERGVD